METGHVVGAEAIACASDLTGDSFAVIVQESERPGRRSMKSQRGPRRSIDKRRLHEPGRARKCKRPLRPVLRTTDLGRGAGNSSALVNANHNIRVQHCKKALEVAGAQCGEKGINNDTLAFEIRVGNSIPSTHAPAYAARELPGGSRSAPSDRGNLIEGQIKHIM